METCRDMIAIQVMSECLSPRKEIVQISNKEKRYTFINMLLLPAIQRYVFFSFDAK